MQEESSKINVRVRRNKKIIEISIDDIVKNDVIILSSGEKIPADGILIRGKLSVDESSLNGESKEVYKELDDMNVRVNLDDRNEKLSYKMRESQTKKNPITLILGDKEVESSTISYRKFGSTETYTLPKEIFIKTLKAAISERKQNI